MARVLVTEKLAPAGLELLEQAGHEVDVRLGLSPEELLAAVGGAQALIIRSATTVTSQLLDAAGELMVVGRAGVGLDNVDVEHATVRGVMVCNAPQSNVVSAAEQACALMLAVARNIPQAHGALVEGRWERSDWTGVELLDKTLGIVGLGRVGRLVAARMAAFGMRMIAYDPFVSGAHAREIGVELMELDDLLDCADFITIHLPKTPETVGLLDEERLQRCKPGARLVNTARGGIVDEAALVTALDQGWLAGVGLDVFATEPTTESPLFGRREVVVTPHLGASTVEAQEKAGVTIAEQVLLALADEFVPFAVNVGVAGAPETVRPFMPLAERLGEFLGGLVDEAPADVSIRFTGDLAAYDPQVLVLSVLRGLLGRLDKEPVTFVNAMERAAAHGVDVSHGPGHRENDFVNLIEVRGGGHSVAGTLLGASAEARIVMVDDHEVEIPPANHLLVIRNDDRPGVIGRVGAALGDQNVNISFMGLGRAPSGDYALMALSTDSPVSDEVCASIRDLDGIRSVATVVLG